VCRTTDSASANVLGKLGMQEGGTTRATDDGADLRVYGIDLTEFQA
jgi:hypothetical protein